MTTNQDSVRSQNIRSRKLITLILTLTLIAITFAVLSSTTSFAATYYVAKNGTDVNPGTSGQPWLTIQHAANTIVAGDTVLVGPGNYSERIFFTSPHSGNSTGWITFKANPRRSAQTQGFNTELANYIDIEGFNITTNLSSWQGGGIWTSSDNVRIIDNYFSYIPGQAVASNWGAYWSNVSVLNNTIYGCNKGVLAIGYNWLVENNNISRLIGNPVTGEDADYTRGFGNNLTFRRNYMHDTIWQDICPVGDTAFESTNCSHTDGFQTFYQSGLVAQNITFEENILTGWFSEGVIIEGNISSDTHANLLFRNNVYIGTNQTSWAITSRGARNVTAINNMYINTPMIGYDENTTGVVQNNIFYNVSSDYSFDGNSNIIGGYNIITNQSYPNYNTSTDLIGVEPQFVNLSNVLGADGVPFTSDDGYILSSTSPAINAGLDESQYGLSGASSGAPLEDILHTPRPQGYGWDIGAFELAYPLPFVTLNTPVNSTNLSTGLVTFNCSAQASNLLTSISLYGNWSGLWMANQTSSVSGTANSTTFTKTLPDGSFAWNCRANDTLSNSQFATNNYSISIDSTAPVILLISPTNNSIWNSTQSTPFTYNVTDANQISSCSLFVNGSNIFTNSTINKTTTQISYSLIPNGNYNWSISCADFAENVGNSTIFNVTLAYNDTQSPQFTFVSPTPTNNSIVFVNNFALQVTAQETSNYSSFFDINKSLLLWYSFDSVNGSGDPKDLSSYIINGSKGIPSSLQTPGVRGSAFIFNTSGSRILLPTTQSLNISTKTVSFWAKIYKSKTYNIVFETSDGGDYFAFRDDGKIYTYWHNSSNIDVPLQTLLVSPLEQTWQFWTLLYNVSGNSVNLSVYTNGVYVGSMTRNDGFTPYPIKSIGDRVSAGSNFFNGSIDEFMIFGRLLTTQEILALYNSQNNVLFANITGLSNGQYAIQPMGIDAFGNINSNATKNTVQVNIPEDIFIANTSSGADSGADCANAHSATWFNNLSNYGNATGQINFGDTIHLCGTISNSLTAQSSGLKNYPITILFEPNAKMSNGTWTGGAISASSKNYLIIDGASNGIIEATNSGSAMQQLFSTGVDLSYISNSEVKNLVVRNIYIHNDSSDTIGGGEGIYFHPGYANNSIHNNSISETQYGITYGYWGTPGQNVDIYNNTIYHSSVGINIGSGNVNASIDNISIYSNDIGDRSVWYDVSDVHHQDGMHIFAVHAGANVTHLRIFDNYIHGDPSAHSTAAIYPEGTIYAPFIFNNIFTDLSNNSMGDGFIYMKGPNDSLILGNTFVGSGGNIGVDYTSNNLTIINNVFYGIQDTIYHENTIPDNNLNYSDYNLFYNPYGVMYYGYFENYSNWKSNGFETHSVTADVAFLNNSTFDYHLGPLSAAINTGANLSSYYTVDKDNNSRPQGSGWDIGAYEYVSPCTTCHYIRAGATGNNDGSDWTNAWSNFSSVQWTRNNTYYLGGGVYVESPSISKVISGSTLIVVKKASTADHGTDVGWNTSFETQQAIINGTLSISSPYITVDGVSGTDNISNSYGIKIAVQNCAANSQGVYIDQNEYQVNVSYVEIQQCGEDLNYSQDGVYAVNTQPTANLYLSNLYIHDLSRNALTLWNQANDTRIEHVWIERLHNNNSGVHGQAIQLTAPPMRDITIRFNHFVDISGTAAVAMLGSNGNFTNISVYGNVFITTSNQSRYTYSPAAIYGRDTVSTYNISSFSNSFYNIYNPNSWMTNDTVVGFANKNNIYVNSVFQFPNGAISANNLYYNDSGANVPTNETGQINATQSPFVNAPLNLSLVSISQAVDAGASLGSIYAQDINGISRPQGNAWDIGAYESNYTQSICTQANIRCVSQIPGPTQEYSTIQACANAAVAGDTCYVFAGYYNETVSPANSGTVGNFINFTGDVNASVYSFSVSQKSYIRIQNFEVWNKHAGTRGIVIDNSSHIEILNNYVHNTGQVGISMYIGGSGNITPSNYTIIRGNRVEYPGILTDNFTNVAADTAIDIEGFNNLVEQNNLTNCQDYINLHGGFNVIRNNSFYNANPQNWNGTEHIDGVQAWAGGLTPVQHNLIENNYLYNSTDLNTHFFLIHEVGYNTDNNIVVRLNAVNLLGSAFVFIQGATPNISIPNVSVYSNTILNDFAQSSIGDHVVTFVENSTYGHVYNNIFYNTSKNGGSPQSFDASSTAGFDSHNNLAYGTSCGSSCTWASPMNNETGGIKNKDPLFVNNLTNFSLQSNSPAIDAGGSLTNVSVSDSGSGTSLILNDVNSLQDGWAGTQPDWIAIGNTSNIVKISAINYSTNTITLANNISRSVGDPVYLYSDSSGRRVLYGNAPDIGAYEFVSPFDCSPANIKCVSKTPGPTQEYSTIQACANAAVAGDTCYVFGGYYNETVTINTSGNYSNDIFFDGQNLASVFSFTLMKVSHVTIKNFEIWNNATSTKGIALVNTTNISILNNYIHDTGDAAISRLYNSYQTISNYTIVRNNTIKNIGKISVGGEAGLYIFGNNNIVENNDISHVADYTHIYGSRNVLRNNVFHDSNNSEFNSPPGAIHFDGMQTWDDATNPTYYLLIEGNRMYNTTEDLNNVHFSLMQDYSYPNLNLSNAILRYNVASDESSFAGAYWWKHMKVYNNDIMGDDGNPQDWTALGYVYNSTYGKIINNILYNATRNGGEGYDVDASSSLGFNASYNLAYNPSCGVSCTWSNPIKSEPHAIFNQDPKFANNYSNFSLQQGSPAIDAGGSLTNVTIADSGSGTTLIVNDSSMFQDGWAGTNPDWIAIGSATNIVQISSINYSTNTITLANGISRNVGDPVYLYSDSSGRRVLYGNAPDIGAYEYAPLAAEQIFVANTSTGSDLGTDCLNAHGATWFNNATNWGAGVNQISAGDTVHLCGDISNALTVQTSGTASQPITIYFEPNARLVSPVFQTQWWGGGAITVAQKDYIIIDGGLNGTIENTANGDLLTYQNDSIGISGVNANYFTVKNLIVKNIYVRNNQTSQNAMGTGIADTCTQVENFTHFTVTNTTINNAYVGILSDYGAGVSNIDWANNTITRTNWGMGIGDRSAASNITNVSIHGNHVSQFTNWNDTALNSFHHNGFFLFANQGVANNISVYANTFGPGFGGAYQTSAIYINGNITNPLIYNNLFIANSSAGESVGNGMITLSSLLPTTMRIYSNTFVGGGTSIQLGGVANISQLIDVQNNLGSSNGASSFIAMYNLGNTTLHADYNLAYNYSPTLTYSYSTDGSGNFKTFSQWQQLGFDGNGTNTSPMLNTNASLLNGSAAIDRGADLSAYFRTDFVGNPRPQGNAWDIGAFESNYTASPPTTLTAATCNYVDVNSTIANATTGMTVIVPAGNCTWNYTLTIGKAITVQANNTTLTAGAQLSDGFFFITGFTSSVLTRITGFTFVNRIADIELPSTNVRVWGNVELKNLRIDHNTLYYGYESIDVSGSFGVIDNNYFYNPRKGISFSAGNRSQADDSWKSLEAGSANALFIENNHFITDENYTLPYTQEQIGTYNGGRLVVRYNNFNATNVSPSLETYTPFMAHGSADGGCDGAGYWESSPCQRRGQSLIEFYGNIESGQRIDFMYITRGSANLVYNNVITGTVTYNPSIQLVEEEYEGLGGWNFVRTAWPAEDQVHNTFLWNNSYRGHDFNDGVYGSVETTPTDYTCTAAATPMSCCTGLGTGTCGDSNTPTLNPFIRLNRDYYLHAPCITANATDGYGNNCTLGRESFIGVNGSSNSYPTDGNTYPTDGTMVFTNNSANAYYYYSAFDYPHPLVSGIPGVTLLSPLYNSSINSSTSNSTIIFDASVIASGSLKNITLYGNWSGGWGIKNSTTISGNYNETTFAVSALTSGVYKWNIYACDVNSNCDWGNVNYTLNYVNFTPITTISLNQSEWRLNETTNFSNYNDAQLSNLPNVNFSNTYGGISYTTNLSLTQTRNLTNLIKVLPLQISVNSTQIPEFNRSANLIFRNVTLAHPIIKHDGADCLNTSGICTNQSFNSTANLFTALVSGFSTYTLVEQCTDGIKNYDETGVDCGGANCGACPISPSGPSGGGGGGGGGAGGMSGFIAPSVVNNTTNSTTNSSTVANDSQNNSSQNAQSENSQTSADKNANQTAQTVYPQSDNLATRYNFKSLSTILLSLLIASGLIYAGAVYSSRYVQSARLSKDSKTQSQVNELKQSVPQLNVNQIFANAPSHISQMAQHLEKYLAAGYSAEQLVQMCVAKGWQKEVIESILRSLLTGKYFGK